MATSRDQCLIWDFDGTLAYRPGMWSATMIEMVRRHAGIEIELEVMRPFMQRGFPWHTPERANPPMRSADEWWAELLPLFEEALIGCRVPAKQARELAPKMRTTYIDVTAWRVFDDSIEVLRELRAEGWRHAILSNHVPELPMLVEALGLLPHIECIVNSAETGFEKPHPEAFATALRAMGDPKNTWMIGDNVVADVLGAEAVGLRAILVRNEDPRAMRRAAGLREVRALLHAAL